jgi:ubiquinol-cytochrome c reductase iron-sulfur subunit
MADSANPTQSGEEESRRDFLYLFTGAATTIGLLPFAWAVVDSMNPSADVLALASIEVDLSPIEEGQSITVTWRGNPIFIRRRTADEIATAEAVALDDLPDPESDADRVKKPEWLVMVGVCTHLGCVPKGQKAGDLKGEFDGWFCPCHGSHYDTSGRIRKGPAPKNLPVPPYNFVEDEKIVIG